MNGLHIIDWAWLTDSQDPAFAARHWQVTIYAKWIKTPLHCTYRAERPRPKKQARWTPFWPMDVWTDVTFWDILWHSLQAASISYESYLEMFSRGLCCSCYLVVTTDFFQVLQSSCFPSHLWGTFKVVLTCISLDVDFRKQNENE